MSHCRFEERLYTSFLRAGGTFFYSFSLVFAAEGRISSGKTQSIENRGAYCSCLRCVLCKSDAEMEPIAVADDEQDSVPNVAAVQSKRIALVWTTFMSLFRSTGIRNLCPVGINNWKSPSSCSFSENKSISHVLGLITWSKGDEWMRVRTEIKWVIQHGRGKKKSGTVNGKEPSVADVTLWAGGKTPVEHKLPPQGTKKHRSL